MSRECAKRTAYAAHQSKPGVAGTSLFKNFFAIAIDHEWRCDLLASPRVRLKHTIGTRRRPARSMDAVPAALLELDHILQDFFSLGAQLGASAPRGELNRTAQAVSLACPARLGPDTALAAALSQWYVSDVGCKWNYQSRRRRPRSGEAATISLAWLMCQPPS